MIAHFKRAPRSAPRVAGTCALHVTACLVILLAAPAFAQEPETGTITLSVKSPEQVTRVVAIERRAEIIATTKGKAHDIGLYGVSHNGTVTYAVLRIDNLPVPGVYDLRIETESGATLAGWDATVPESDYVGDPPLEKEGRRAILDKLADEQFSAFSDRMWVLDIQGNIQNASLLVMKLRTTPFVGGNYQPGEWVWRIERWQWENPDDHTWVPYQERPFYALIRQRLYASQYNAKRIVFARSLGGIALTPDRPEVNLGEVTLPPVEPGICAVNPDGSRITPVVLKGPDERSETPAADKGAQE